MLNAFRRTTTSPGLRTPLTTYLTRSMATGPQSGGEISDELLARLGSLSTQALVDGLWVMGWPNAQIDGSRALDPSHKCCGRAVTLQFMPARPDIAMDKPPAGESPEYEAFEKCGPNEVRMCSILSLCVCAYLYAYRCVVAGMYRPPCRSAPRTVGRTRRSC